MLVQVLAISAVNMVWHYDTIRYDSVYLTCSEKLTGSQPSLPHGINKKILCETKNKMMSVIFPLNMSYGVIYRRFVDNCVSIIIIIAITVVCSG